MQVDKITWSKIDKFFESPSTQGAFKYFNTNIQKVLTDNVQDIVDKFNDYLIDEFRLQYADSIHSGVRAVVTDLLKGKPETLAEFNLSPDTWGLRSDPQGIRQKIVDDNIDAIKNTYIMELETRILKMEEKLEIYRERYR